MDTSQLGGLLLILGGFLFYVWWQTRPLEDEEDE